MTVTLPSAVTANVDKIKASWANTIRLAVLELQGLLTGWIEISDTWTRTGNHTFTISGDVTAVYRKATKIRYKDGGSYEYGYIGSSSYSAPNTTINLIPNTDYAMAAATITSPAISYSDNPEGFPQYFNYTVVWTGFSAAPTNVVGRFHCTAGECHVQISGTPGTSNANTLTVSVPVTNTGPLIWWHARAVDNGSYLATPGMIAFVSGNTALDAYKDWSGATWTTSGGKIVDGIDIQYMF